MFYETDHNDETEQAAVISIHKKKLQLIGWAQKFDLRWGTPASSMSNPHKPSRSLGMGDQKLMTLKCYKRSSLDFFDRSINVMIFTLAYHWQSLKIAFLLARPSW